MTDDVLAKRRRYLGGVLQRLAAGTPTHDDCVFGYVVLNRVLHGESLLELFHNMGKLRQQVDRKLRGGKHTEPAGTVMLRIDQVMAKTSLSRTSIYRLEKRGDFPGRRKLSKWASAWIASEVEEWLRTRPSAAGG